MEIKTIKRAADCTAVQFCDLNSQPPRDKTQNHTFSPCGWRQHGLQFGNTAIHWHQKVDVGEGCGVRHGLCVVFVIYPEVSAVSIAAPAQRKVQRSRLDPPSQHLGKKKNTEQISGDVTKTPHTDSGHIILVM